MFKIVQFSDTELLDEFDYDPETLEYDAATLRTMEAIILAEQPDLVVFAGDMLEKGGISGQGSHAELLEGHELYAKLVQQQFSVEQ
jgi:ABC-type multidrug transport system fused ATPase/permease subunit